MPGRTASGLEETNVTVSTGEPSTACSAWAWRDARGIPLRQQRPPPVWVIKVKPYVDDPGLDADIPLAQRRSLLELASDNCRWPVGDPSTGDFFFCGAHCLQGTPYCAAHEARARRSGGEIAGHGKPARRRAGDHSRGARAASGGEVANRYERGQVGR